MSREPEDLGDLRTFIVELGAAMNASGQPVDVVQERLCAVAEAHGHHAVRVSAFPTFLMVTMGTAEPAALELTTPLSHAPRLDQIAAIDALSRAAVRGEVAPGDGVHELARIRELPRRFRFVTTICGYSVLAIGLCLVLQPTPVDVAAAALFGAVAGALRSVRGRPAPTAMLVPVAAAFAVAALDALAVRTGLAQPGLRAIAASLVVFLPGAALTTAVLELGSGEAVSGASRLVSGATTLALLAFGILCGVQAVGVAPSVAFAGSHQQLGSWSPWAGVLVFAVGATIANSAPKQSFLGLLIVLYAAWIGQVAGNALIGAYGSALVGAAVMTVVAFLVSRLPGAMPPHASFLPGFWLLVPGALGLIGVTQFAGDATAGTSDIFATVGSIFGVALGVTCGTLLWRGVAAGHVAGRTSTTTAEPATWYSRFSPRSKGRT